MSPNLVQTDAQRPEPALNRWRPTLGSTLALPEEHAPAERIMRAWRTSVMVLELVARSSSAAAAVLGSPPAAVWTPLFMLLHACPPLFSRVQPCRCARTSPEREQLAKKTTTEKQKIYPLLFCGLFRRLQANIYLLDSGEQGSQDRAAA